MSQRSILFGAIMLVAVAATAFGQPQPPKKNLKLNQPLGRFTPPPNAGPQPGVRVPPPSNVTPQRQPIGTPQPQPRVTPQPQSGRTGSTPVRPEDWLRLFTQPPPQDNSRSGDRSGSNRNTNSVPARGSAPPPARPVLTADQFATLTLVEQRQVLYSAATSLDQDLGKLNSGASWKKFLSTTSLLEDTAPQQVAAPQQDAAHSAETRERLKRIADQYDKTQLDPQYRAVSGLWGFQMVRNGLREYAAAPVERGQRRLDVHTNELQQALGQLPAGAGWKTHLQLDELNRLANSKDTLGPADRNNALALAERFQQVAQNPKYRSIVQLDGFETSRQALQQLASQITQLADSQSPGGVLQLVDPNSAEGILQLAESSVDEQDTVQGQVYAAIRKALDEKKEAQAVKARDFIAAIQKEDEERAAKVRAYVAASIAAIEKEDEERAAKVRAYVAASIAAIEKEDEERAAKVRGLFGIPEPQAVTILPLGVEGDAKPQAVTILPLGDKKPEDGKDTDKSKEKKKKP